MFHVLIYHIMCIICSERDLIGKKFFEGISALRYCVITDKLKNNDQESWLYFSIVMYYMLRTESKIEDIKKVTKQGKKSKKDKNKYDSELISLEKFQKHCNCMITAFLYSDTYEEIIVNERYKRFEDFVEEKSDDNAGCWGYICDLGFYSDKIVDSDSVFTKLYEFKTVFDINDFSKNMLYYFDCCKRAAEYYKIENET